MKKALKELIMKEKLSDDEIITLISNRSKSKPSPTEKDVKDEENESEETADSEEQSDAEGSSADKETTEAETPPASSKEKGKALSVKMLEELIQKAVTTALESKEPKLPAQLPLKKPEPKPKPKKEVELGLRVGEFNLIG